MVMLGIQEKILPADLIIGRQYLYSSIIFRISSSFYISFPVKVIPFDKLFMSLRPVADFSLGLVVNPFFNLFYKFSSFHNQTINSKASKHNRKSQ